MGLCNPFNYKTLGALGLILASGGAEALAGWSLIPGPRFQSGREAALSGAYLPIGDDVASALFNNPADVARFKGSRLDVLNLSVFGNLGYTDTLTFGLQGTNALDVLSLSGSAGNLRSHPGKLIGGGASLMTGYAFKNYFAVGMLWQSSFVGSSDGTNITYRSAYQLIPTASVGLRLASGVVRIGYNIQWVNQALTPASGITIGPAVSSPGYADALLQGSGLSHNAGFAMTLPYRMLPSFNFVARNIGGTSYSGPSLLSFSPNPSGAPSDEPMSFDASISLQPKLGSGIYMNWIMQVRDLTNTSGVVFLGRVSTGVELSFSDRFFVRGGWGSNYPSLGLGFRHGNGDINLTFHNEEYGTQYNTIREPRFLMQYLRRAF